MVKEKTWEKYLERLDLPELDFNLYAQERYINPEERTIEIRGFIEMAPEIEFTLYADYDPEHGIDWWLGHDVEFFVGKKEVSADEIHEVINTLGSIDDLNDYAILYKALYEEEVE